MWMPNKNGDQSPAEGEPLAETQPSLRGVFADVYRFILQAVNGDRATADTLFEDYLDGKLSELACTRFRRHRVRCFDGAGGGSWRDGSLLASSSLRLCG